MRLHMQRFLAALLLVPSMTLTPLAGAQTPKYKEVIAAQAIDGFLYGPIYIARHLGYFEAEGIDFKTVVSGGGTKAFSTMLSDSAAIYVGAPTEIVNAAVRGQPTKAWALLQDRVSVSIVLRADVAAKAGLTATSSLSDRIKSLKGLKLGTSSPGSSSEALYRYALGREGINADREVELVPVGGASSAVTAFTTGKVDSLAFSSPVGEEAIARGPGIRLINFASDEVKDYAGFPYIALVSKDAWLEKNAATAEGIVRAIAKAERYLRENPAASRAILRKVFDQLDEKVFQAAFEANLPAYPADPTIHLEKFLLPLNEYKLINGKDARLTPADIATDAVVAKALARK